MTKEELSVLKKISKEIEQIKRELDTVEPQYVTDSVTASDKEFPYTEHQVKIKGYDRGEYNCKVRRINNRLNRKLEELMDEKDKALEYIYTLEDSDLRQILTYTYINGFKSWEVAEHMGVHSRTVERKLKKWNDDNAAVSVVECR